MKCKNCGAEFNEGIFCPECGTKVDQEEIEQKKIEQEQQKQNQNVSEGDKKEENNRKDDKKINRMPIISLICGIASWIGLVTVITPLVCGVIAIVFGIKSLKRKAKHRGCAIAGIILAVLVYAVMIWIVLQPSSNNAGTSDNTASTETVETVTDESIEETSESEDEDEDVSESEVEETEFEADVPVSQNDAANSGIISIVYGTYENHNENYICDAEVGFYTSDDDENYVYLEGVSTGNHGATEETLNLSLQNDGTYLGKGDGTDTVAIISFSDGYMNVYIQYSSNSDSYNLTGTYKLTNKLDMSNVG